MPAPAAADAGLVAAWLDAEPEWRIARVFLPQARERLVDTDFRGGRQQGIQ